MKNDNISVLDKGYVRLVDVLGSDLTPVNAARVSYDKQSNELTDKDRGLIKFLISHGHTSPFRHAMLQFEVYAPLMVARQWWKYCIGSAHQDPMAAWNESSRRYITEEPEFETDCTWRSAPDNSKQGSGSAMNDSMQEKWTLAYENLCLLTEDMYEDALSDGMCAEQARKFLLAYGMYVRWYWTVSLQGVLHFLDQRLEEDAQVEIQAYAKAVLTLVRQNFPETIKYYGGE